jgi:hypothetical protein
MSDIKISELPEVGSLISTDITPFVASGTTSKIRLSNLANTMPNVPSATSSSYSLTSSYSNYAVTSSVASRILGGVANYIPIWYTDTTLDSSQLYQLSNNIIIGGTTNPDNYKLYVIGSAKFTNGLNITGSVKINNLSEVQQTNIVNYNTTTGQLYYQNTGSFTASYSISSSYAQTASYSLSSSQAITASFITASNVLGPFGRNSILSASYSVSSSNAQTASYILNAVSSSYSLSSSFAQTASYITTAQTASFITASNVLGPFGRNSIISASYSVSSSYSLTSSNILGGTNNYVTKWTSPTSLGSSVIYDDGTNIGIGMLADSNYKLLVSGSVKFNLGGGPSFAVLNKGGSATLYGAYTDPVSYPNSYFARADGVNSVFKIPGSGGTMYFEGVSGFKMALSENGNFSIGTTADDGYRLDVNDGPVRFRNGLTVTGSGIFNSLSLGTNPINVTK